MLVLLLLRSYCDRIELVQRQYPFRERGGELPLRGDDLWCWWWKCDYYCWSQMSETTTIAAVVAVDVFVFHCRAYRLEGS
jgi:hypothetical protein